MWPAGEVGADFGGERPRQPHGAGLVGLDAAPFQPAGDFRCRLGDPHQRCEPRVDGVGELLDLDGVQEAHLAPLHLGELDPGGDVAGELAAVDRGVEDLEAAYDPGQPYLQWTCPLCPYRVFWGGDLEGHTAEAHPGWTAEFEILAPYPHQRLRVVYRRVGGGV